MAAELGLDRDVPTVAYNSFFLTMQARDYEGAAELLPRVENGTRSTDAWRLRMSHWVATLRGRDPTPFRDSLVALVDSVPALAENFKREAATARILAGDEEAGWSLLEQDIGDARAFGDIGGLAGAYWNAAELYARYGREEDAFAALDQAVARPMRAGFSTGLSWLELWPGWDPLRDDPRFDELMARQAAYEAEQARLADEQGPWLP